MGLYIGETIVSGGGGTSPFEAAKKAGYTGTEEEFNQLLAIIPSAEDQAAWDAKMDALDYTPANEATEEARPANRLTSTDGGTTISVELSAGLSVVQTLETITRRGVYTLYVSKGCPDNPPGAEAIVSSLRGIAHITLTKEENDYMYAWILLFDKEGNMYTRYTSNSESTWVSYAKASDVIASSEKGAANGVATLGEDGKVPDAQLPDMTVDAYTKAQSLTSTTAAQFGLAATAVPDDVLSWIGKYNEYWWSLRHLSGSYQIENGNAYPSASGYSGSGPILFKVNSSSGEPNTILSIADSVAISESGVISLVSPTQYTYPANSDYSFDSTNPTPMESMLGKYCSLSIDTVSVAANEIFYIPASASYSLYGWEIQFSVGYPVKSVYAQVRATTYEHSTNRNAYPDSGTVDGITYKYLGVPFDNARVGVKLETGSYIGTNKYGSDNPNSLTFQDTPEFVLIMGKNTYGTGFFAYGATRGDSTHQQANIGQVNYFVTWSGNTMSWYTNESSMDQLNLSNSEYVYFAFR